MINRIAPILLRQTRGGCGRVSVDYEVAITLLGATIRTYRDEDLNELVSEFTFKLDELELLLKFWNQLAKAQEQQPFPSSITEHLKIRIERDFWLIEHHYRRTQEKNMLDFFKAIKDRIITIV